MADTTNLPSNLLFENLTNAWEDALKENRQREVILGGIAAYCYFHQLNEENFETAALIYVRQAIEELLRAVLPQRQTAQAPHSCSFCGGTEPQVRLAAGANGFICDSCVRTLGEVFKQ